MDFIICAERIGRYIEDFARRFRIRKSRIQISRGILLELKKEFEREENFKE